MKQFADDFGFDLGEDGRPIDLDAEPTRATDRSTDESEDSEQEQEQEKEEEAVPA